MGKQRAPPRYLVPERGPKASSADGKQDKPSLPCKMSLSCFTKLI